MTNEQKLREALQDIVDAYDARSELYTSDAECAQVLAAKAGKALRGALQAEREKFTNDLVDSWVRSGDATIAQTSDEGTPLTDAFWDVTRYKGRVSYRAVSANEAIEFCFQLETRLNAAEKQLGECTGGYKTLERTLHAKERELAMIEGTPTKWTAEVETLLNQARDIIESTWASYPSRSAADHVRTVMAGLLENYEGVCHDIDLQNNQLGEMQAALHAKERELADRDNDWILAMAAALGTDSGYSVLIVPTPEAFRAFFATLPSVSAPQEGKAHLMHPAWRSGKDEDSAPPPATPRGDGGEAEAFERTIVAPLRGRYNEKQRTADFAMFSLGYHAATQSGKKEDACTWTDGGCGAWNTSCGIVFGEDSDADPVRECMRFCFNCGKPTKFVGGEEYTNYVTLPSPPASKGE